MTEDGMSNDGCNDIQSLKHLFPMTLTDDGMDIEDNEVHPLKHLLPISVTEYGMEYEVCLLLGMYSTILFLSLSKMTPLSTT